MASPSSSSRPRLALIAGPTASRKSALAVALAQAVGRALVVIADASQVYRDLAILSARPTPAEMAGVPHRPFGPTSCAEAFTAATWAAHPRPPRARSWGDVYVPIPSIETASC